MRLAFNHIKAWGWVWAAAAWFYAVPFAIAQESAKTPAEPGGMASKTAAVSPTIEVNANAPAGLSAETFEQFLAQHPQRVEAFWSRYGTDIIRASAPQWVKIAAHLALFVLLFNFVVSLAGGWICSKITIPLKATWKNALIFALAETGAWVVFGILVYALAHLMFVGDPTNISWGYVILLVVLSPILAIGLTLGATFFVYRVKLGQCVVYTLIFFGVSVVLNGIGALMGSSVLSSNTSFVASNYGEPILMQAVLPYVQQEVRIVRDERDELVRQRDEATRKLEKLESRLAQLKQEEIVLQRQLSEKEKSDEVIYAELGKLADRPDLSKALTAYENFLKERPQTPMRPIVEKQIETLKETIASRQQQKEKSLAEAAMAAARELAEFKAKYSQGEATLSDVRKFVLNKSRTEVTAILGPPSETAANAFLYSKEMVTDPVAGRKRAFWVMFEQGVAQTVKYGN
jgi:hypothetical protein